MTTLADSRIDAQVDDVLDVRPLSTNIGAEIHGVDARRPLDEPTFAAVQAALFRWKVLFFRGQHLGHQEQANLARHFGPLTYTLDYDSVYPHSIEESTPPDYSPQEVAAWRDFPEIRRVDNRRAEQRRLSGTTLGSIRSYHTGNSYRGLHFDSSASVDPPSISLLRAETVPDYGGDTTWFNTVAAYEGLSPAVRGLIDGLWAEHVLEVAAYFPGGEPKRWVTHHPLVRVIPETGERALLITPVIPSRVLDVTPDESAWILEFLYSQVIRPGYGVRFKWEPGDFAISDNRTTLHLGPQDLSPDTERVLHLVLVAGDLPVSVDGRQSVAIVGGRKEVSPRRLTSL